MRDFLGAFTSWKEKLGGVLHVDFLVDDIVTRRVHHWCILDDEQTVFNIW